jgi:hypothetical membrane protein
MKPYIISAISGLIVLVVGIYNITATPIISASDYLIPAIGVLFLGASPAIKKDNKAIAHIIVVFTLVLAIFSGYKAYMASLAELSPEREKTIQVYSALAITCAGAFAYYLQGFIERKKSEQETN